jgi:HD-GYP domain-containing protein (c-di-GMP phosphodiesterase class II)
MKRNVVGEKIVFSENKIISTEKQTRSSVKKIDVSSIIPDTIAEGDFYSEKGELLIAKGTIISRKYIDALTRRNIFEVLSREFEELEGLKFDGPSDPAEKIRNKDPAPAVPLPPEFKGLKPGEEGSLQLNKSSKARELDNLLQDGFAPDKPVGPALNRLARQVAATERTPEYVSEVTASYSEAIAYAKEILNSLAEGARIDEGMIRNVVDRFIKTYLTDKSILINITNTKAREGEYLYHHMLNVCLLAINIAAAADYSQKQILEIGIGALLHDVGMLLVPVGIRFKKGRLTRDEWYEVQKHAILGLHILEKVEKMPETSKFVAYQVHERENGKGYPKQRAGRLIHNYAKIVQIADIYESLCSPREYRSPYIPYRAMELLIKMSNQNLVSGEFVKAFLAYASVFPIGSIVELNDHRIAKVIQGNEQHFTKPVVSIIMDEQGKLLEKNRIYQEDISKGAGLHIVKALEWDTFPKIDLMFGF